jgi:hypothetical protein
MRSACSKRSALSALRGRGRPYVAHEDDHTEEETLTISLTGTAKNNDSLALTREVERALLRLLASRELRDTRVQEEVVIDAENFWTQAEEACAVDPIG